jgi:flagellar hook-associated protein 2
MTINVKKLASASQVALAGQTANDIDLGTGSVLLSIGGGTAIEITPTTNTLAGIATAINEAQAGVSATVINDGSGSPYRLVVTSSKTGEANAISSLSFTGYDGLLMGLDVDPLDGGATVVTPGADAEVRVGDPDTGMLLKSASNLMDQAIPGLALNLLAVGDGVNITVSQDAPSVRGTVQTLVDSFNSAQSYFTSNSKFDVATLKSGALFNDYDLRSRLEATEQALTQTIAGQPSGFQKLADVGVTIDSAGKMTIDTSIFEAKLAENQDAVASLFLAAGAAGSAPMEQLTRSVDGSMSLKLSNLEDSIASYTQRIATVDARMEVRRKYYESKFLAMEKTIAALQSQSNALNSFTTGLNASKNN